MYAQTLVTPPTAYPVTIADVKAHAVITIPQDDSFIGNVLIPAATEYAQAVQKRQLMPATWRLSMRRFPVGDRPIPLPLPPLVSIASITYIDSAGALQTMSSALYGSNVDAEPGFVAPIYAGYWPATREGDIDVVAITYVAGYGATNAAALSAIPASTKLGILMDCAERYRNREGDSSGIVTGNARRAIDALLLQDQCAPNEDAQEREEYRRSRFQPGSPLEYA